MNSPRPILQKDWNDFNTFIYSWIPKYTIPTLKLFADTIAMNTNQVTVGLRSGERKSDIISKLQTAFLVLKSRGDLNTYATIRLRLEEIAPGLRGWYPPPDPAPPPTFGGIPIGRSSGSSNAGLYGSGSRNLYGGAGSSGAAGGSTGAGVSVNGSSSRAGAAYAPSHTLVDWKPNPMWRPVKALTPMEYVPDVSVNDSSATRRCKKATFVLPGDVIQKLEQTRAHPNTKPRYSVRIFATSSDHYNPPHHNPTRANLNTRVPIEFPNNPDVQVDYSQSYHFKEKGLRGKAGSAPPFDVERVGRLSLVPGRLTSVTFGQTGPTVGKRKEYAKRFWFQVVLAEMVSKEDLLDRLNKLVATSAEDAIREFKKKQDADDDIMVGTSVMSLKDPLAYMRISRPVRSSKCSHIQCFDPQWWIESNTVHPQWLCPHCNKELNFDDLIIDGYVLSILNAVPDSVDDVVLEPSGEWHTEDNKYGSAGWFAENPSLIPAPDPAGVSASSSAAPAFSPPPETKPSCSSMGSPSQGDVSTPNGASKRKIVEILSSDDDEAEAPLTKTNDTNSRFSGGVPSSRNSSAPHSSAVIDLTLSDSDDDDDAQPRAPAGTDFRGPGTASDRAAFDSTRPPSVSYSITQKGDAVARYANGGGRGEGSSIGAGSLSAGGSESGAAPAVAASSSMPSTASNYPSSTAAQSQRPKVYTLDKIRACGMMQRQTSGGKSPVLAMAYTPDSPASTSHPNTPHRPSSAVSNLEPGTSSSSASTAAAPAVRPVPPARAGPPYAFAHAPRFGDFRVPSPSATAGTSTSTPGSGGLGSLTLAQGSSGGASSSASGSRSGSGTGGVGTAGEGFAAHASTSNPWSPSVSASTSASGAGGGTNVLKSVPGSSSKAAPVESSGSSSEDVRKVVRLSWTETDAPAPTTTLTPAPTPASAAVSRPMRQILSADDQLLPASSGIDVVRVVRDKSLEEGEVEEEEARDAPESDGRGVVNGRGALDRYIEERFWQGVMDGEMDDLYP